MATHVRMDDAALRGWVAIGLDALGVARAEIDGLNVYPVPDGDTGTNLYLTFEQAADAVTGTAVGEIADTARALARGALLGARGNSGVILSQLLRGMADELAAAGPHGVGGATIAAAFTRASELADAAVDRPVEGTILTVAREAAAGACAADPDDLAAVIVAAADRARSALARTPQQLEALRRAGVVDAGGRGFVVLLDAMVQTLTGKRPPITVTRIEPEPAPFGEPDGDGLYAGPAFEVMFMLESDDVGVAQMRTVLSGLGDSLVIVGGDPLYNVHVHVDDAGAAVEAAITAGRPSRIRITHLRQAEGLRVAGRGGQSGTRALVVVAHGPGIREVLESGGATVVMAQPRQRPSTAEILDGIDRSGAHEIVVLPSDKDTLPVAEAAAEEARDRGLRVSVIPSRSVVQSLAAVAVHDAARLYPDDVVAMTRAAGATRYGAVTIAAREGMTSAGICQVGDVLGLAQGDIVEIGDSVSEVATRLIARLCDSGSELITIVTGSECTDEERADVADYLRSHFRLLDIVEYAGGQPYWPFIIGVE